MQNKLDMNMRAKYKKLMHFVPLIDERLIE